MCSCAVLNITDSDEESEESSEDESDWDSEEEDSDEDGLDDSVCPPGCDQVYHRWSGWG